MSTMMHTPVEQFPLENRMGKLTTDEDAYFAQSVDDSTPSVSSDTDSASDDDDESKAHPHADMVQATVLENPKFVAATDQQEWNMLSTCADDAHCVAESKDAVAESTGNADHPIAALSSQSIVATGEADMDLETHVSVVESPGPTWDSRGAESNENVSTALPGSEVDPSTQPDSDEDATIQDFPPVVEESTSPIFTVVHAMLNDDISCPFESHVVADIDRVHNEDPTIKEFEVNLVLDDNVAELQAETPEEPMAEVSMSVEGAPAEFEADYPEDDAIFVEVTRAPVPLDDVLPDIDHSGADTEDDRPVSSFDFADKLIVELKSEDPAPDPNFVVEETDDATDTIRLMPRSEIVAAAPPDEHVSTFAEEAHAEVGFEDEARSIVILEPVRFVEENEASSPVQDSDDAVALAEENIASDPTLDTAKFVPPSVEKNSASASVQDSDEAVPFDEESTIPAPKVDVEHSDVATAAEVPSAFTTSHSAVAIGKPLTNKLPFVNETSVSAPKEIIFVDFEPLFKVDAEDAVAYRESEAEDIPAELVVENGPAELAPDESDELFSPWDTTDQTLAEDVEVPDVKEPEIQNQMILQYPILDGITDYHEEFDVIASSTTEIVQDAEGPAMLTVAVPAVGECHLDETERSSSPEVSIRDVHEFDATEIEADVEATIRALLALSPINEKPQNAVLPSAEEIEKSEEEDEADATAVKFDPLLIEEESIEEQQVTTPAAHEEPDHALVEEVVMTSNIGMVYFEVEPEKPELTRDVEHNLAIDVDASAMPFFTCPDTPYGEDEIRDRYAISEEVVDEKDDDVLGREDDNDGDDDKYALSDAESIKAKDVITITTVDYDRTKTKGSVRFVDVEPETPSELLSQAEVLSELSPIYDDRMDGDAARFNQGGCVDCVIL